MRLSLAILIISMLAAVGIARHGSSAPLDAASLDALSLNSGSLNRGSINRGSLDASPPATTVPAADPQGATVPPTSAASTIPVGPGDPAVVDTDQPRPRRIRIRPLDLDAEIVPVGVDDEGLFEVPGPDQVGWYRYGPAPGEDGSAVLAAHVDYNGELGAFFELARLEPGELVHLDYTDGSSESFVVVDQTVHDKRSLPAEDLFGRTGRPTLRLATCGGRFDPVARSYQGNRVVTAVPVGTGFDTSAGDGMLNDVRTTTEGLLHAGQSSQHR